jgi:predicted lipid carrier protein YhbT
VFHGTTAASLHVEGGFHQHAPGVPDRSGRPASARFHSATGAEPGNWVISVKDGACTVVEGDAPSPNVTINTPSDVWLKILRRELDGATAFMSGQFTFTGDMGILMQMGSWFEQGEEPTLYLSRL